MSGSTEVRQRLEALGDVNLGAIEEHEELRERFRFLEEQKARPREQHRPAARGDRQRINRTSRKRFRETFDAVNERFQKNFPRLFRGGKAWLTLTETEDVLEAGIEIIAQPPGKRLQSVNLLSGGEKTMTAIALLVSRLPGAAVAVLPARRGGRRARRRERRPLQRDRARAVARESQFLLITHNKRTIEVADILYGVTMEETRRLASWWRRAARRGLGQGPKRPPGRPGSGAEIGLCAPPDRHAGARVRPRLARRRSMRAGLRRRPSAARAPSPSCAARIGRELAAGAAAAAVSRSRRAGRCCG